MEYMKRCWGSAAGTKPDGLFECVRFIGTGSLKSERTRGTCWTIATGCSCDHVLIARLDSGPVLGGFLFLFSL